MELFIVLFLPGNKIHDYTFSQVWQMAENIYNDEEPETPASELEPATS